MGKASLLNVKELRIGGVVLEMENGMGNEMFVAIAIGGIVGMGIAGAMGLIVLMIMRK